MMNKRQAYNAATSWGSYMSSGDPGACFYGFKLNDGRPASEAHRAACIAYIDDDLLPSVSVSWASADDKRDRKQLVKLREFFVAAPLNA